MRAIDGIRRRLEQFLTERCDIQREVQTRGAYGELVHGWDTVAVGVPCRVITAGTRYQAAVREIGSQTALQDLYRVILRAGTVVQVQDRIVVGGVVYEVWCRCRTGL